LQHPQPERCPIVIEYGIFILLGIFSGLIAGLLGIGGGLVVVPILLMLFPIIGLQDTGSLVHLAIGTSLATIMFSSLASIYTHHKHGGVLWPLFGKIAPGIILGSALGASVAHYLPGDILKKIFGVLEILLAINMAFGKQPAAHRNLPGTIGLNGLGLSVGAVGSIMGMGGGALTTPFFMWCNVAARNAIATSAAIGLPTALAGAAGYVITGWNAPNLPAWSLGYIYLPALLGIVIPSLIFAPIGANLTHKLPAKTLKRVFAVVLVVFGINMLVH
jgi:uncharacterized membrane protein YfcA